MELVIPEREVRSLDTNSGSIAEDYDDCADSGAGALRQRPCL